MATTIALLAADGKKNDIVKFAVTYAPLLNRYKPIATGNTADRIQAGSNLSVEKLLPGSLGGVAQIAAEVAAGNVVAAICLVDPLQIPVCEPDIQMLLRICNINNVPVATNLATAEAIATRLAKALVAHLIFNPISGRGNSEQDLALIKKLLEPNLHLRVHQTTAEISAKELTQQAIEQGADIVIASGGDGTVSAVAGALIGTGIPLGIIPRGTANAFAVALGIPRLMPIRNACQVILAGQIRNVDAARCNGYPTILLVGVGYEAETVERASRELKAQWGPMAYLMAGWQLLEEANSFDTEIEVDGNVFPFQANAITVANAAPPTSVLAQGGGEVIFDDGLLDVTIATTENKLQAVTTMLGMLGAAIVKTGFEQQNVVHTRSRKLKISTNPPQKVVIDGEIMGTTPIEVECIPDGLTVLAPNTVNTNSMKVQDV